MAVLFAVVLCLLYQGALAERVFASRPSTSACFPTAPGTKDRSSQQIKIIERDWMSQQIATYLAEIVLKEWLGYDVQVVDGAGHSTSLWGPHMEAGHFDLDMENWQVAGPAFVDYVTDRRLVYDLGPVGYPGRSGIFLSRGPETLAVNEFLDYFYVYRDAAAGMAAGLNIYGETDIRSISGAAFPLCGAEAWCPAGATEGYWISPQCQADPSQCLEVISATPGWDAGYFEQLTKNLGLKFVHGYYGGAGVFTVVNARLAQNKSTLFYWFEPDPQLAASRPVRLSYPDSFVGCGLGDSKDPTGEVACDYPELTLRKLGAKRLRQMAEALYFLQRMQIFKAQIEAIMLNTTAGGGQYTGREAACVFLQQNVAQFQDFAPDCIVKPKVTPVTGDLVFNPATLECTAATVYDSSPLGDRCLSGDDLGTKDRSGTSLKVAIRGWTSADASSYLAAYILQDLLNFDVSAVNMASSGTSNWGLELPAGLYDVELESWQASPTSANYIRYITAEKSVLDLGEIGYEGRAGAFAFQLPGGTDGLAFYYKYYKDTARFTAAGFPRFGDVDLRGWLGADFPFCNPATVAYCQTGAFEGYWAPPQCQADPTQCTEFLQPSPTYDTGFFEQLTRNFGLKIVHGYYGWDLPLLLRQRFTQNKQTLFYWWEPDPLLGFVHAERISYPDHSYGCTRVNNNDADTGLLECDYPATSLRKLGHPRLITQAPEAYYFLTRYRVGKDALNSIMASSVAGRGNLTVKEAACKHLKENFATYKAFVPDCISRPKLLAEIGIGDTVFDPDSVTCMVMDCPAHQILTSDGFRAFCQDCPEGLTPNGQRARCQFCPSGMAVSANRSTCTSCDPGFHAEFRGMTQCEPCPKGAFVGSAGATSCELCAKGRYAEGLGSSRCDSCPDGKTTVSRGTSSALACKCGEGSYQGENDGTCMPCPEGMRCLHGSRYDDLLRWAPGSDLVIPLVEPGYFTERSAPMSVYLCDGADEVRCPGGGPQTCGGGRIGMVCDMCKEGYSWDNDEKECMKCDAGPAVLVFAVLPVVLILLGLIMFKVANDPITVNVGNPLMMSVLVGLLVTTFQTLALFPGLSIRWKEQGDFFKSFTFLLGSPEGLALGCALSSDAVILFMFRCLLPILCVAAVFGEWLCARALRRFCGKGPNWSFNFAHNTLGQLLQTLFIAIAVLVAQPLRCYGHPNGTSSMSSFPQILCWEGGKHTTIMILGFLIGALFVVPFMSLCILAVLRAPTAADPHSHYQKWRFLLYRFRPDVWWWGIVFLFRQMMLAFSSCIPADNTYWQITYVALVTGTYIACMCAKWPWKNGMLNIMDVISMMLINFIIVSCGAFVEKSEDTLLSFVILHFCLMGAFAFFVLGLFISILYWVWERGLRGEYGRTFSGKLTLTDLTSSWMNFVKTSSSLDTDTYKAIFMTFNEYDIAHVVKAMSSFQSLEGCFGASLAPRLRAMSHSSRSVEDVAEQVRATTAAKSAIEAEAVSSASTFTVI